jgi:diguanylate cyclase (GGDEF)-like protein
MADFLSAQLDFIFFFYGLAFILLGITCLTIARREERTHSWTVLGWFAFLHGAGEWLDLAALIVGDTPRFAVARTALMITSFVFLMDFARLEGIRLGLKIPGRWLYVPLISLSLLVGITEGLNAAAAVARYSIGFVGAMTTGVMFARLAKELSGAERRLAIFAAVGFALYAVAAGMIVPPASIWPATVVNQLWFLQITGVPIQFVRGLLACWIAFSIWGIWGQRLVQDASAERYTKYLRKQFVGTLLAMTTILVFGWMLTEYLGGIYKQNVQAEAQGDIDLLASRFSGETATVEAMVKVLAGSPSISPLLVRGSPQDNQRAQKVLDLGVEASGAKMGYVLNGSGAVIASSKPESPSLSEATFNLRALPLFQSAIAGQAGHHFAFDAAGAHNYYASYPIRSDDGKIIGVTMLRKSLEKFETDLMRFDHPYFFVDPEGIVALTNRPEMLRRPLWPLPADHKLTANPVLGSLNDRPLMERELTDATWTTVNGERDYVRRRYNNHTGWSLILLMTTSEMFASRVLGIVITLLVTIMTLIYLFGRERRVRDSVQTEKRLELQQLAHELELQANTDPLTGLFNRLKFNQALAIEILRSKRYQTLFSLMLFDIDHFKAVNDTFGHQVGDNVLVQLSRIVTSEVRATDLLARWGGEEFVVMINVSDQTAQQVAEKLRVAIGRAEFDVVGNVTCSFGLAQYIEGDTPETLLARADRALYRAKLNGRNRVELAPSPVIVASELASVA